MSWFTPTHPALRERCNKPASYRDGPSPALRERVPSGARRVRVSPPPNPCNLNHFSTVLPTNAQPERPPIATGIYGRRAAHVVGAAGSAVVSVQVPATASNRGFHRRLRLHQIPTCDRNRWQSAREQCGGRSSDGSARKARLASDPVLEQRRSRQYECGRRGDLPSSGVRIDPHPPSPTGWAPPSPAVRERGCGAAGSAFPSPSPHCGTQSRGGGEGSKKSYLPRK
jgi:hypothetical protein